MKSTIKSIFTLLLFLFILLGCKDENNTMYISLNTREITLHPKDEYQFQLKIQNSNSLSAKDAIWSVEESTSSTSSQTVITVDDHGLVKAHSNGRAMIKATLENGRYALAEINVVSRKSPEKGVNFNETLHYMSIGGAIPDTLKLTIKTQLIKQFDIQIKTTNSDIIAPKLIAPKKIDEKNKEHTYDVVLHRGGAEGIVKVYVQLGDSKFESEIHVGAKTYLSFNPISLALGEPTLTLTSPYTFQINTRYTINIYYLSTPDDPLHLDALNFKVRTEGGALFNIQKCERNDSEGIYSLILETGQLKGNAKIYVTLDNHEAIADCTVMDRNDIEVTSIAFDESHKEITTTYKALSLQENITIEPLAAKAYWPAIWSSSNPEIATVNNEGSVVIKQAGTFRIIATSKDKSDDCTIHAQLAVTSIAFESGLKDALIEGESTTWNVTVDSNYGIGNNRVIWSSSDENIATVNEKGQIKAIKSGKTIITAMITDDLGQTYTAKKELTIQSAASVNIYDLFFTSSEYHYYKDLAIKGNLQGLSVQVYDATGEKYYIFSLYKSNDNITLNLKGKHTYTVGQELHLQSTVEYVTENETATLLSGSKLIVNNGKLSFEMKAQKAQKTINITGSNITSE